MSALAELPTRVIHPVYVGIRGGAIVRLKVCASCGAPKLVSDDSGVSEYHRNTLRPNGLVKSWKPRCKPCENRVLRERRAALSATERRVYDRQRYERVLADPVKLANRRRYDRERQRRYRRDPVKGERIRARVRAYAARERVENRDEVNELQRLRYHLRREREGKTRRNVGVWVDVSAKRVSMAPFRDWLQVYQAARQLNIAGLAGELDLEERYVRRVLGGTQSAAKFDLVDRALLNAVSPVLVGNRQIMTLDDLYPPTA